MAVECILDEFDGSKLPFMANPAPVRVHLKATPLTARFAVAGGLTIASFLSIAAGH